MRRTSVLWMISTVLIAQSLSAQEDAESYVRNRIQADMDRLISSAKWSPAQNIVGFKSIYLGMQFDVSNNPQVRIHDYGAEPFRCSIPSVLPIVKCKVEFVDGIEYPKNIAEMHTAFGSPVAVSFSVLLNHAPNELEVKHNHFGSGRVAEIQVDADEPNPTFVNDAVNYFSAKFGTAPKSKKTYQNPQEVYSPKCQVTVDRLYRKPIITWSQADEDAAKLCDLEAANSLLEGNLPPQEAAITHGSDPIWERLFQSMQMSLSPIMETSSNLMRAT